ncbi:MAG TPA: ABC transporter ATP-binding protein [Algoriphagus sp.]|uniref:ABC transporter ATP-binding protein n=1 Tax=Algoriphagus sp. TaxID=1872435 RepID=UPI000E949C41|nr:ABC transporter ATP-binding protein [Algoriphagus sp.]HAS61022.1 ABC transporter ATP-binding protein [Algoriphagus sp.]
MNKVIKVSNLSKRYRLGLKEKYADTLVGKISQIIRSPYDNLKRLRDLNRFGLEDDSVFWALKDVSFEVKEGEVLGIIGKNGAGKSTLLKILSQITEPTSGNIEIHGRVASLLEVGTGFHPELSGRENIYMNGTILGMTRREIDSKLDEIIDFSGVEKFIDTPVKFYSSGMKVRLGFSVAAHLDPEILIIDEVLAVGDYEFQKKCLGKMEDVSKNQGRTVLFVSHNLEAVRSLCTHSLLMTEGFLHLTGRTENVVNEYLKKQISSQKERKWEYYLAPGNELVKVAYMSVSNSGSLPDDVIDRTKEIEFNFEFWFEGEAAQVNLSLVLYSIKGECIFNVITQVPLPTLNKGYYLSKCVLPSHFLNENEYKIDVLWVKDAKIQLFKMSDALLFEVVDQEPRKINWFGKFPGVIHPKLDFVIEGV